MPQPLSSFSFFPHVPLHHVANTEKKEKKEKRRMGRARATGRAGRLQGPASILFPLPRNLIITTAMKGKRSKKMSDERREATLFSSLSSPSILL